MRALKTQEKIPLTTAHKPSNISPKTITVKRNTPSAAQVTTTTVTETTTVESSGELLVRNSLLDSN